MSTISYLDIPSVTIPEGESGPWRIKQFSIDEHKALMFNLRIHPLRRIIPGTYTGIYRNGEVIMSDTPAEKRDHVAPVKNAKGRILINGLGLGMVLQAAFELRNIEHATVIEKSEDVIKLSGAYYKDKYGDKLTIIHDDAMEYKPAKSERFGMVWHDIWDDINTDNLPAMGRLHRRYGRIADWQGSWCHRECLAQKRKENSGFSFWRF